MSEPRLLDLFCGAGGAARGYQDAGFYVVGVDIEDQPNYCGDEFIQADALAYIASTSFIPEKYDLIHASPPCQRYSDLAHRNGNADEHPDLIGATRELLEASGVPWVIENVEGAPLCDPVMLCGTMFPGLRVLRHRLFEASFPLEQPAHPDHPLVFTHDKRKAHYGKLDQDESFVQVTGGGNCTVANARDAMGIDWMTKAEINEAIPPAYSRWVGEQFIAQLEQPSSGNSSFGSSPGHTSDTSFSLGRRTGSPPRTDAPAGNESSERLHPEGYGASEGRSHRLKQPQDVQDLRNG